MVILGLGVVVRRGKRLKRNDFINDKNSQKETWGQCLILQERDKQKMGRIKIKLGLKGMGEFYICREGDNNDR